MTSHGQFTTRVTKRFLSGTSIPDQGILRRLLLFDFGTNSSRIGAAHDAAIRQYVSPLLEQGGMNVWMAGMASRLGSRGVNARLSAARVRRVAERIDFHTTARYGLQTTHFGEDKTHHGEFGSENSAYSRAVLIVVSNRPPVRVPERPVVQPRSPYFHRFKIMMAIGGEAGEFGVAFGLYDFWIDYDNRSPAAPRSQEQKYRFIGTGAGGGAPIALSQGLRTWNYFTLPAGRTALPSQFAGTARVASVGVATGSLDGTSFMNVHLSPAILPEFDIMRFRTDWSFSAGASALTGDIQLID